MTRTRDPGRQTSLRASSRPTATAARTRSSVRYRLSEKGRGALFVNGKRRALTRFPRTEETIVWNAKVRGRPARPGVYGLQLVAFDPAGNRSSRTPAIPVAVRYVALGPQPDPGRRGGAVRGPRLLRRGAGALDARRPQRVCAPGHPEAARPAAEGAVHADGLRQRAHGARRRVRPGARALTELARLAGPLGCLGLALLLVATRRELRLAGLVAWAAGAGLLGLYLAPDGRTGLLFGGAVGGLVVAAAGAWILLRWPWVLPFATLACIPIRIPIDIGDEEANLLLPLYAVIGVARARARLAAPARRRPCPRARPAGVAARRGRRLDGARPALDGRPTPGRDLPRRLRAAVRPPRRRRRAAALQPARSARPLRRPRRDRARLCRDRPLSVGDAGGVLEPEAAGRQRLCAVLPRQLRLLGPVDLRPLPRRRHPGDAGPRSARRAGAAAGRQGSPRSRRSGSASSFRSRSRASSRSSPARSPPRR